MSRCFGEYGKSVKPRRAFASETGGKAQGWYERHLAKQKDERETWKGKFSTPEKYIEAKLKILRRDMLIEPTEEELIQLRSKKTEVGIDSCVKAIIARAWS